MQKLIAARGLKQKAAAKTLGVTQPRVSDLLCGRLFSTTRSSICSLALVRRFV
ncbi:MAG: hypothetical protein E8D42_03950 [Nitrospira sp.]|nr:MAG: hypothetical protein E8D42_03950 [Nitrospira sp.]